MMRRPDNTNYSQLQSGSPFMSLKSSAFLLVLLGATSASSVFAAPPLLLQIKNHHFTPAEISIPAGQRVVIEVQNLDNTPEEFESYDLKIEKLIVPHGKITVNVGPVKAGSYKFFGDYNPTLATGTLHAVDPKTKK